VLHVVVHVETIDATCDASLPNIKGLDRQVKQISLQSSLSWHWVKRRELNRLQALGELDFLLLHDSLGQRASLKLLQSANSLLLKHAFEAVLQLRIGLLFNEMKECFLPFLLLVFLILLNLHDQ